jgi:murein DD-endopeptidase MepM/ murein hydrolase activator NlpD
MSRYPSCDRFSVLFLDRYLPFCYDLWHGVNKAMDQIPSTHSEQDAGEDRPIENNEVENNSPSQGNLRRLWGKILEAGLGETTLRIGTGIVSIILILVVVWVMSNFFLKSSRSQAESLTGTVTPTPPISLPASGGDFAISTAVTPEFAGVSRLVNLHTNLPSHPRDSVMPYTVAKGDTLFDIADKFGLKPESLFWSNRYILGDNPDNLIPGLVINIPPQDGAIYQWNTGDGLNGVAKYYKVTVDAIIDWPGNHLDRNTLGDYSFPNIPAGTQLFIPDGKAEFTDWLPHITRGSSADAGVRGPGYCGTIDEGPIGSGSFIYPTGNSWISGYNWAPPIHNAIDFGGTMGIPIYAADSGVVVYSGWNNNGYGYLIVIDHGNGWQTRYAHLSQRNVECGAYVYQGDVIGLMGSTGNSTGPHLHFELLNLTYGKVNPLDFLH